MPGQTSGPDARELARRLHQARLVLFFEDLDVVVHWNGSATFNVTDLDGQDLDVFETATGVDVDEARRAIERHMEGWGD